MMNKAQAAILALVDSMGLNLSAGEGPAYMHSDWPWKYLWEKMQNEAYKLKINAMKLANEAQTRHQAKSNTVKSQQWEYGEVYNDRRSKSRAKILVLDELERRSGKQLVKAEEILSGIISELSCEHGLDEAAIWSSHTKGRMQAM